MCRLLVSGDPPSSGTRDPDRRASGPPTAESTMRAGPWAVAVGPRRERSGPTIPPFLGPPSGCPFMG
jgi:hypothetical protein